MLVRHQRSLPLNLSVRCARLQQLKSRLQEVDSEEKPRGGLDPSL